MSERSDYPAGVPCWVDILQPDPEAAMRFYGELFGWQFEGPGEMPGDPPGRYYVATARGLEVAGIGSLPDQAGAAVVAWNTHVAVASVEDAMAQAVAAGGEIVLGPVDAQPAGRFAVVSDPAGASICLWEARARPGAKLVNEPSAWAMSMLQSTDADHAAQFYTQLFGWQPEPFDMDGAEITLWRRPGYVGGEPHQPVPRDVVAAMVPLGEGGGPSRWGVEFWIDDAAAAAEKTPTLGGQVLAALHEAPPFKRAVLADPSGAAFTVSQLQLA